MAKRRTWKRDKRGRFAGGSSGDGPVNGYRKARSRGLREGIKRRNASERNYVAATGDRGTARDRQRLTTKNRRAEAKAKTFDAKVARARAKRRR